MSNPSHTIITTVDAHSQSALHSVLEERVKQNVKWGEQNHDLGTWGLILGEEFGEFCEAALHTKFGGPKAGGLREEAVQVAAVALQIVEFLDREAWEASVVKHGQPDPFFMLDLGRHLSTDAAHQPPPVQIISAAPYFDPTDPTVPLEPR